MSSNTLKQILPNSFRLPKIHLKPQGQTQNNDQKRFDSIDQKQNDLIQVNKLEEWTLNKPTRKAKKVHNTHKMSLAVRQSLSTRRKNPNNHTIISQRNNFIQVQLYLAKIQTQLMKIGELDYFSIFRNLQYCSGLYQNSFNSILRTIQKYHIQINKHIHQQQSRILHQRQQHMRKLHELQQSTNQNYKNKISQVRQALEDQQQGLKPIKRLLRNCQLARNQVLKYCLALGYDVRNQGLTWILKELGEIPRIDQFPKFLTQKEIYFIIDKYINQNQVANAGTILKKEICGKTINQAYEFVNRRKRRQLSLIKQDEQIVKLYESKIKNYSNQKHRYLYESTLLIAQQLQKDKPKPTKYQIIYSQASKKLNKLCRIKIHPQLSAKGNASKTQLKQQKHFQTQQQRRSSTLIVQQFSKMLSMSMDQTKKMEDLHTKEERQFQQILRQIRYQKYNMPTNKRNTKYEQIVQNQIRNPISILGCLLGCRKAEKIIQQEMFTF